MIASLRRVGRALLVPLLLLVTALSGPVPTARAEQLDVAATVRGVVRVVLFATKGDESYFVGHGTGFAVAPDKILTNAHVVELLRTEPNLVLGIIPSQGKKSYGGKLIAYSPGNDLALIQLTNGRLPVVTFFAGAVTDGQHVTAIGYPGSVDRAQGLDLNEMIQPLPPVKTSGTVSMGRTSHGFDTLLHTAPMAQGNSGGPLVDDCGRVLGVNSFGAQAESDADAEFGFAISNREVASFLRQAGVTFQRTSVTCRSIAELDAEEAKRSADAQAKQEEQARAEEAARDKALGKAREQAEQQVYSARENAVAISGLLLLLGGLGLGAAMMFHVQGRERERLWAGAAGGLLLAGALLVFFLRPSFSSIDERIDMGPIANSTAVDPAAYQAEGKNICRIDEGRSRITISEIKDVPLRWAADGCMNGDSQYGHDGPVWNRIFAPANEAVISVNSFDPATGTYKVERYLADDDTLSRAREMRAHFTFKGCTRDPSTFSRLQQMQSDIRSILPPQPNERLVYQCARAETVKQGEKPAS